VVFLFRDKSIINVFLLVILSMSVHLHFFINSPQAVFDLENGFFSWLIAHYVQYWPGVAIFVLYHGLVLSQAFRLNQVLNNLKMFPTNNFLPAMTLVLLSGLFPIWCTVSPALMAGHFLIWLFARLARLFNHASPKTLLFNTGIVLGIAIICYHPFFILVVLVLFALAIVRPFNLNEWVVLLIGVVIPYYFVLAGGYLFENLLFFFALLPNFSWGLPVKIVDWYTGVSLGLLAIGVLFGLIYWQRFNGRMLMQIRKYWSVMLLMLLLLLALPFLVSKEGMSSTWLLMIPATAFFSAAFSVPRRLIIPNLFFLAFRSPIGFTQLVFYEKISGVTPPVC